MGQRLATLKALLEARPDSSLREVPGPRYHRPQDPIMLLRRQELAKPVRYGGDNSFRPDGKLLSRPTDSLVAAVKIGSQGRSAADFTSATDLPAGKLPYAGDCSALIAGGILLNADVAAAWSGQRWASLKTGLDQLLSGNNGGTWGITQGVVPSPVAIAVWTENPWLPLFLTWDAGFAPLHATLTRTTLSDYDPDFFLPNFTVDPATGSFLSYTPKWLSAADGATAELNDHPAHNPICGWVMPNHLTRGFFFYDAGGRPVGSMFVAGSDEAGRLRILWQGAPGDDRDIDTGVVADPVVAAAHPQLRALVRHLGIVASVADFRSFDAAVDAAHTSINPANLATDAGLSVLVGRPVALVQAALT